MALRLRIPGPVPRRPATRPPLERCNWIVDRLGVGRTLTVGDVARQFEVSPRTAYRDIEFLRDRCQAPLAFDAEHSSYVLTDKTYHPPLVRPEPAPLGRGVPTRPCRGCRS